MSTKAVNKVIQTGFYVGNKINYFKGFFNEVPLSLMKSIYGNAKAFTFNSN